MGSKDETLRELLQYCQGPWPALASFPSVPRQGSTGRCRDYWTRPSRSLHCKHLHPPSLSPHDLHFPTRPNADVQDVMHHDSSDEILWRSAINELIE